MSSFNFKNNNSSTNCAYNELVKFDTSKPMASFSNQLLAALTIIILNNLILQVILKHYPGKYNKKQNIESVIDKETKNEFKNYSKKLISPNTLMISEVVNASIYAPIIEEVFFRFLLLKMFFIKYLKMNVHSAVILHATIFGAFHMTNVITSDQEINKTVIQSVSAGLSGIIYGYAYIYTNSIFTPLIAHFINNIMSTTADYIEYSRYYKIINKNN